MDGLIIIALAGFALEALRSVLTGSIGLIVILPFTLLIWVMLFRNASEILLTASEGGTFRFGHRFTTSPDGLALRHIGLWLLYALLFALCWGYFGVLGAALSAVTLAALVPAATLLLTLRNSLLDSFDPVAAKRIIETLGFADYGRLCGLLVGLTLTYLTLDALASTLAMPLPVQNLLLLVYWAWALIAWFYLAGCTLFEHRNELTLAPDDEALAEVPPERFTRDPDRLWATIQQDGGSIEMHRVLADSLDRGDDQATQMAHGKLHVAALLEAFEQPQAALDRAAELLQIDQRFALDRPSVMVELIQSAARYEQPKTLHRLIDSYLHHFPTSRQCNELRLLGCEALQESSGACRKQAKDWYQQLMTSELDEKQRQRMESIASSYLQPEE